MDKFKFILKPYKTPSDRLQCPSCGSSRELSPYISIENGEIVASHVGRCNRELKCGYNFTPAEYFKATGSFQPNSRTHQNDQPDPLLIDSLPNNLLEKSIIHVESTNLFEFFKSLFGQPLSKEICSRYLIGASKHWKGANLFPQIDINGSFRQCKIILYDPRTGKRVRQGSAAEKYNLGSKQFESVVTDQDCSKVYGKYLSEETQGLNLQQCFFGEHLLKEHPNNRIAIVESEKTAMIASVYHPDCTWIATGGSYGCKWTSYFVAKVLEGREVIMFPDLSNPLPGKPSVFEKWRERSESIMNQVKCKIKVSDVLETSCTQEQKESGLDIADLLVKRDDLFGWALTDLEYPLFWDL